MTNHPDETHSLRERVDEAISWFTGTDEPAPVEPDTETPDEAIAPAAEPVAVAEGTEPAASEPVEVTSDVAEQPVADAAYVAEQPAEAEPIVAAEPAVEPVVEPVAAEPAPTPWSEPVAAPAASTVTWPGADAATPPVSFPKPSVTPEPAPELEQVEEPAAAVPARAYDSVAEPARAYADVEPVVSDESVDEALVADMESEGGPVTPDEPGFEPVVAGVPAPYDPIATEPVATTSVESSEIDEPTRIHPIDASLGAPIVDESAAEPVTEAPAVPETYEDDFTEPLAADAAADAEAARQRSLFRDVAPPIGGAVAGAAAMGAVAGSEKTAVLDAQEAARLRREERAARDRQLGKVIASQEDDEPLVTPFTAPSTYKGLPSFGLFLFRLVIAAVVGIRAWQHITHLTATTKMWEATVMQSPGTVAWVQIGLEIAIALMLVLGLGTRIAGILLVVLSVVQLAFVQWGAVNPFQPGATDFIGIVDVLLAVVGVLLATVGGGRAAIDGAIHTGHVKRKNSKLFA